MRAMVGAVCGLMLAAGPLPAIEFYVDNLNGRDTNNGRASQPQGGNAGPVQSIRRALELVASGDAVHIANTGEPYYESLSFVGTRLGGVPNVPLTIFGHGATLSGLRQLPARGWRLVGDNLWQVTFTRKGFGKLFRDGLPLPEFRSEGVNDPLAKLPPGQWCMDRGSVYFRQDTLDQPGSERFDYAAEEMGITLYRVDHVRIVDLTVQHFRVDGINAHNMCSDIVLDNVVCRENGRCGVAVGGTSSVTLRGGQLDGNGRHSALITGLGHLVVEEAQLDVQPAVQP